MNKRDKIYELIIIGSGISGLFSSMIAKKLGIKHLILESKNYFGGLINHYKKKIINNIDVLSPISGESLLDLFSDALIKYDTTVLSIDIIDDIYQVTTSSGTLYSSHILIASGSGIEKRRELEVPIKNIKYIDYRLSNINEYIDKSVAVFGGGQAAIDSARIISKNANTVYLIHRRDEFRASIDEILSINNINILKSKIVAQIDEFDNKAKIIFTDNDFLIVDKILVEYGSTYTHNFEIKNNLSLFFIGDSNNREKNTILNAYRDAIKYFIKEFNYNLNENIILEELYEKK